MRVYVRDTEALAHVPVLQIPPATNVLVTTIVLGLVPQPWFYPLPLHNALPSSIFDITFCQKNWQPLQINRQPQAAKSSIYPKTCCFHFSSIKDAADFCLPHLDKSPGKVLHPAFPVCGPVYGLNVPERECSLIFG